MFQTQKLFRATTQHEEEDCDIDVLISDVSTIKAGNPPDMFDSYFAMCLKPKVGGQQQEPFFLIDPIVEVRDSQHVQEVPEYISELRRMKFVEALLRRRLGVLRYSDAHSTFLKDDQRIIMSKLL